MFFFATTGKRPVRLSEQTRRFAMDSLNHRYGLDTRKVQSVPMDDVDGFEKLSPLEQYDAMIRRIAELAPLRLCEGERISGAATLGKAIDHRVPATLGDKVRFGSVSHLTIDFETVLTKGVDHIQRQAQSSFEKYRGTEKEAFAQSCLNCIDSMRLWYARYLEALRDREEYGVNFRNLQKVPFGPAESFYEAVQSLWFTFAFVRLCGNWPGIGRIDRLLGKYLKKDLADGTLTLDEAREILAHFFIKGCEWICGGDYGSGDAQHYQNIVLAGVDEEGREVTNEVTYLVLDILEELGISDFPTTVRINRNTDARLMQRVAQVIAYGGGVIAVYNEELIIDSLVRYGYPLKTARRFANDGCWEIQIPGETHFTYAPFDALALLQQTTLQGYERAAFESFEELMGAYLSDLKSRVRQIKEERLGARREYLADGSVRRFPQTPCTVVSLFERGCIERGCSYYEGGPNYEIISPHIGGLPDVTNALYAIYQLVFEERKVGWSELMDILRRDWEGQESLRQYVLHKCICFGNDNDAVDGIAVQIVSAFADVCDEGDDPIQTPGGISTFGRQIEWSPSRLATPFGKKAHDVLAGNFSPTPGTDRKGATAIIRSYCKADLRRMVSGAALDIRLLPSAVKGARGIEALTSLICGFCALGGHFMQIDIADTEQLLRAQEHPAEYPNLSVRISGWNARFVTLNKEWQDMIIEQRGGDF